MKTANFILPFDPVTQQTGFPAEPLDWVHLTPEQGNTVVAQVRGEDAVIESMKLDPVYCWLEKDDAKVKAYLQDKGHEKADLDKLKWTNVEDVIESVVKLHGQTLKGYRAGGLG